MAEQITFTATENNETIEVVLNEQARGPAGPSASLAWSDVTDKPSTFPPDAHTHTLSSITDAGNSASLDVGTTAGTVAAGDHTHTNAQINAAIATDPEATKDVLGMDMINVMDYGATGDGVADDTAEIQAAITAASNGLKALYLPPGTYKITAELVISGYGLEIVGAGPDTTVIQQATGAANALNYGGPTESRYSSLRRLRISGLGGDVATGTGIHARSASGGFLGSQLLIDNCRVDGFANGIWAQHMPKLVVRDTYFENNVVGARLQKADTFLFSNVSMGASGVTAETWAYIIEAAASAPAVGNFGGIIDIGEYGDLDHFVLITYGTVSIRQPNLERVDGSYVVRAHSNSFVTWEGGRISNASGTSAQAVFSLNCDTGNVPALILLGYINLGATGWRTVEAYNTFYSGASARSFAQPFQMVFATTAGGTAVSTTTINPFFSRRTDAGVNASASFIGWPTLLNPDDGVAGAQEFLMGLKDPAGTYKKRNLVNDSLMSVASASASLVGNVTTTETKILEESLAAYAMRNAGWSTTIRAFGKFENNTDLKRLVVKSQDSVTIFDTTAKAYQNSSWEIEIEILARYATAFDGGGLTTRVKFLTDDVLSGPAISVSKVARGFSQANTFQIYATGVNSNDIVMHGRKASLLKNSSEY
jgi:hypothetical protein